MIQKRTDRHPRQQRDEIPQPAISQEDVLNAKRISALDFAEIQRLADERRQGK